DGDRKLGVAEIDFESQFFDHRRSDFAIHFHRSHWKTFVAAPSAHPKCARRMLASARDRLTFDRLDFEWDLPAEGEIGQTEDRRGTLGNRLVADLVGELYQQSRTFAPHRAELGVRKDSPEVMAQLICESPSIAAFERNFVISADQITHRIPDIRPELMPPRSIDPIHTPLRTNGAS